MDSDEDDGILRSFRKGGDGGSPEAVRRLHERIFRLAWRICGDAGLAEEAAARALAKVWSRAGQWREESAAGTWIYRLAVRTILDVQRGERRWWRRWKTGTSVSSGADSAADGRPGPAEQIEDREQRRMASERIREALEQLEPADRALVHLYYFESRGLPEIAEILEVGRDALKMRLSRARSRLRVILEPDHEPD